MSAPGRKLLERTKGFVLSLDDARDCQALSRSILEFTREFGAEHVLAGVIPTPGAPPLAQKQNILLKSWPEEWSARYFRRNYLFNDPTIRSIRDASRPFYWDEIDHLTRDDWKSALVMNEAREFGLSRGITVPLFTIEGDLVGFSLAGAELESRDDVRHAFSIIANYAVARAIALREAEGAGEVKLSHREREALQWLADGRLRHEISEIMRISEHGVDKHLRSCRAKFKARTTSFAVAEALRLRIIS
jgi:LuxR family quorum sensing-dependent transcriptional regulator